jgi:hypothetical protein
MRYLALDVGDERIGVAVSDEGGALALPLETLRRVRGPASSCGWPNWWPSTPGAPSTWACPCCPAAGGQAGPVGPAYARGLEKHIQVPILFWDERDSTRRAPEALSRRHGPTGAGSASMPPPRRSTYKIYSTSKQEAEPLKATRIILRLLTLVLTISLPWSFWSAPLVRLAGGPQQRPDSGYAITARNIERTVLGLYLRQHADQVDTRLAGQRGACHFCGGFGPIGHHHFQQLARRRADLRRRLFRRIVQYWDADEDIQAGAYSLSPGMTWKRSCARCSTAACHRAAHHPRRLARRADRRPVGAVGW